MNNYRGPTLVIVYVNFAVVATHMTSLIPTNQTASRDNFEFGAKNAAVYSKPAHALVQTVFTDSRPALNLGRYSRCSRALHVRLTTTLSFKENYALQQREFKVEEL